MIMKRKRRDQQEKKVNLIYNWLIMARDDIIVNSLKSVSHWSWADILIHTINKATLSLVMFSAVVSEETALLNLFYTRLAVLLS